MVEAIIASLTGLPDQLEDILDLHRIKDLSIIHSKYNNGPVEVRLMSDTKPVAVEAPNNTLGIISLVSGIIGVILFLCCSYISVVLGIVALICGILGYQQKQQYALAGIILGAISIVLGIIFIIVGQVIIREIVPVLKQEFRF